MGLRIFLLLLFLCSVPVMLYSQEQRQWMNYTTGSSVGAIVDQDDYLWLGSNLLVRFNKITGEIKYFDAGDGLPYSFSFNALLIDNEGILWVGTRAGLARQTEKGWEIYTRENSDLPSNIVRVLANFPGENAVLVGTHSGLVKFDGESWTDYTAHLPSPHVNDIATDNDGNIWVGTLRYSVPKHSFGGGGLAKFDGEGWTIFHTGNSGIKSNWARSVAVDRDGIIWVHTGNSQDETVPIIRPALNAFDGESWTHYHPENSDMPIWNVSSITVDDKNELWMTSASGLLRYDRNEWMLYSSQNMDFPANQVNAFHIDNQKNMWIGVPGDVGSGGLVSFDETEITHYDISNSLLYGHLRHIGVHRGKIVFPSVRDGGLVKFDGRQWGTIPNPLIQDEVQMTRRLFYLSADDDHIWVLWDRLMKYDGEQWEQFTLENSNLQSLIMRCSSRDCDGNYWFGTRRDGLARYDGEDWTVYHQENSALPDNSVRGITVDIGCNLWITTDTGLTKFDGELWSVYLTEDYPWLNRASSIVSDQNNHLWISRGSLGLVRFDGQDWEEFTHHDSDIPYGRISALTIDDKNNLLFSISGTAVGSHLVKYDGKSFTRYSMPLAYDFAIDDDGHVWMANDGHGIGVFREDGIKLSRVRHVTVSAEQITSSRPTKIMLHQNYPNPFNPVTVIRYEIPEPADVRLEIIDLLGRRVDILIDERQQAGAHRTRWDATGMASGVYIYRLTAGDFTESGIMTLVR